MAKILFIDDRLYEVARQWQLSGCASKHELLPLEPFTSIKRTCQAVAELKPVIIFVGYGLGSFPITGADVIRALRQEGYNGYIVANSGGSIEQFNRSEVEVTGSANRSPRDLKIIVDKITERR